MRLVNRIKILIWYFYNTQFLPNLFLLILNKLKELFSFEKLKFTKLKKIYFLSHQKFYKTNFIKSNSFKNKEIYKKILDKNKNIFKFFGGEADLDLIYSICKKIKSNNFLILETGVALRWSSLVFLFFLNNNKGQLFSIDMPYVGKNNHDYVGSVVPNYLRKKWSLYRFPDSIALKKILKKNLKFDLIHYDSDKSYYGRKKSYEILWNLLKKKGFFISDDISDNYAFINFVKKKKLIKNKDYFILKFRNKYIGIAIKI